MNADCEGFVKVSAITDIRPCTTDSYVAAECHHCFEIETTEKRSLRKINRELRRSDVVKTSFMSKGSPCTADVSKFADMSQKQDQIIAEETFLFAQLHAPSPCDQTHNCNYGK